MTQAASPALSTSLVDLYRHVWDHARGARSRMTAALAMLGGSQLLKLALPWMAAQAINSIQASGVAGLAQAGRWIAGILGLQVLVWAIHGPARVMERSVALRVRRSIADMLYTRLSRAPLAWHERHHSGDLQHRVSQASGALSGFTESQFIYLQNLINVAGPLIALSLLSHFTGALAVVGFVLIALAIVRFDGALMRLAERENHAQRGYASRLLDFVGNISSIASLRLQDATRRLLDSRLVAVFGPLRRSIVINEWKWCAVDLLTVGLSWGLVVAYAWSTSGAAAGGTLLIGSLFMIYQYAQQAANVLGAMASNYQNLARTQTDFASADIIRQAPQTAAPATGLDPSWQRIDLHGIAFQYASADRGGLKALDLSLSRGERIALVGPSGSGKSTLLRVLAGLYDADHGHLSVDGLPLLGRRHVGELATLIPQEAEVFELSVRDNITLGADTPAGAVQQAVFVSALDGVLAGLPQGLETPMSERGANFSGGQRQRVALARGFLAARDSSLLLLDEPTSALDVLTEHRVHQRLDATFPDACVIAAVHRLSLLTHFDRVVFMVDGHIVDVGSPEELTARQPLFARMHQGGTDVSDPTQPEPTQPAPRAA
jgi:ABC-type multidrug transport system fused ATPase/permease subunit